MNFTFQDAIPIPFFFFSSSLSSRLFFRLQDPFITTRLTFLILFIALLYAATLQLARKTYTRTRTGYSAPWPWAAPSGAPMLARAGSAAEHRSPRQSRCARCAPCHQLARSRSRRRAPPWTSSSDSRNQKVRSHTAAMDSYPIAMDSYQLIAPSIKTFDSYPQGRVR